MKILVAGASGLVGSALCKRLKGRGHQVVRLVRSFTQLQEDAIYWDPQIGELKAEDLEGFDAIVNLAGENIAGGRWTEKKKRAILHSRVSSTRLIGDALQQVSLKPKVLVNASAIGYYGDRGDRLLDESASTGEGFLSEVCQKWEEATRTVPSEVRVVNLRIGVVLSTEGGALKQMLLPFRLYAGGVVGSGEQYMSWIHIDDLIGVIEYAIHNDQLLGPANAVSPNPVTNREFTKSLGAVLDRPTVLPLPAPVVKLIFGEMGKELLLSSTRVDSTKIENAGYAFSYPNLRAALQHLITG